MNGRRRGTPRRGASAGLLMLMALLFAATALPYCMLLAAGLMPTMVAVLIDNHRAKYLTRTVGAMNCAGVAPFMFQLWAGGSTLSQAQILLAKPIHWLAMYSAAAIGWLIYLGMPAIARVIIDVRADHAQHQLKARAGNLVEDWGQEVAGQPPRKE